MKSNKLPFYENETYNISCLINNIREFFQPYYNKNDIAHNIEHADNVCHEALRINKLCGSIYDDKVVIIAAYAHDMFAHNRKYHHILSRNFILEKNSSIVSDLPQEEIELIATACFEHRSSSNSSNNTLSDIIKSADKGKPDIKSFIKRSFNFLNNSALSLDEKIEDVVAYLVNTFSKYNGYYKPSNLYLTIYNEELEDFYQSVELLSSDFVLQTINT